MFCFHHFSEMVANWLVLSCLWLNGSLWIRFPLLFLGDFKGVWQIVFSNNIEPFLTMQHAFSKYYENIRSRNSSNVFDTPALNMLDIPAQSRKYYLNFCGFLETSSLANLIFRHVAFVLG